MAAVPFQPLEEIIERDRKGVWSDARENLGRFFVKFEAPKLSNIVVEQCSRIEIEDGAGVFTGVGFRLTLMGKVMGNPEQLSGHAQVDVQDTAVEFDEDLFAAATHSIDQRARQLACR